MQLALVDDCNAHLHAGFEQHHYDADTVTPCHAMPLRVYHLHACCLALACACLRVMHECLHVHVSAHFVQRAMQASGHQAHLALHSSLLLPSKAVEVYITAEVAGPCKAKRTAQNATRPSLHTTAYLTCFAACLRQPLVSCG